MNEIQNVVNAAKKFSIIADPWNASSNIPSDPSFHTNNMKNSDSCMFDW